MAGDSYLVYSLKYRPQTFDEIWCQDPVKETLKKAIQNHRVAHSYLFCGPRGVGKTTTARILAKALNCEQGPTITPCGKCTSCQEIAASRSMDVIEIDGASNRNIDDIRELRENIKYSPSAGHYKVYIIDEVHMLTEFAFNALLKTLEEPPRHAKFIFATTAPHKVPSTIQSRCQRYDFRKATTEQLVKLLTTITRKEKVKVDDEALFAIARRADGSIRDAETVLDQMSAFRPEGVTLTDVEQLLGLVSSEIYTEFVDRLKSNDPAGLVNFVNDVFDRGYNLVEFFTGMVGHVRALLAMKLGVNRDALGLSPAELKVREAQAAGFSVQELMNITDTLVGYEEGVKYSLVPRALLEIMALKLAAPFSGVLAGLTPAPAAVTREPPPVSPGVRPKTAKTESPAQPAPRRAPKEVEPAPVATEPPVKAAVEPAQAAGQDSSPLWDRLLTELRSSKPILASVLENVGVVDSTAQEIRITQPVATLWDDKDLRSELKQAEDVLSQLAGHAVTIAICRDAAPAAPVKAKKGKGSAIDKLKSVYDCEEI